MSLQHIRCITFLDYLPQEEKDECIDVNKIKCAVALRTMAVLCASEKSDKMCSNYVYFVKKKNAENLILLKFVYQHGADTSVCESNMRIRLGSSPVNSALDDGMVF